MRPFMIVFSVEPLPENLQAKDLAGGYATVVVFSNSVEKAHELSTRYISEYGWSVNGVEYDVELSSSRIADLDALSLSVLRKAELSGISAHFDAWPKKARPGVYSFESLRMPPKKG